MQCYALRIWICPDSIWWCSVAIPIALYRPHLNDDFGQKYGKTWPRNGKMAILDPFLGQFSHFSAVFPLLSPRGQNPFFGHSFPFRAGGARNGVCTGQSGSQIQWLYNSSCSLSLRGWSLQNRKFYEFLVGEVMYGATQWEVSVRFSGVIAALSSSLIPKKRFTRCWRPQPQTIERNLCIRKS